MSVKPREQIKSAKRIVLKIGSALVTDAEQGVVRSEWLNALTTDIKVLLLEKEVILVSSGAIALGRRELNIDLKKSPQDLKIEEKQAAASIGQIKLLKAYTQAFSQNDQQIAQILLTPRDTEDRRTHLNARAAITTLLEHKIIPIVNENDTTATDEIRFGDNDKLAARVAQMMQADLLLILSTTDGLYTDNPQSNPEAKHIPLVERITDDFLQIAAEVTSGISSGGMKSKMQSAQIAVNAGTPVIITSGKEDHALKQFITGQTDSTFFPARDTPHNARKKWIQAHLKPKGTLIIDDGAEKALRDGRSLLPVGVKEIEGQFERGDAVSIQNLSGLSLGVGLSAYDLEEAQKIIGLQSSEIETVLGYAGRGELIHRNDLVII